MAYEPFSPSEAIRKGLNIFTEREIHNIFNELIQLWNDSMTRPHRTAFRHLVEYAIMDTLNGMIGMTFQDRLDDNWVAGVVHNFMQSYSLSIWPDLEGPRYISTTNGRTVKLEDLLMEYVKNVLISNHFEQRHSGRIPGIMVQILSSKTKQRAPSVSPVERRRRSLCTEISQTGTYPAHDDTYNERSPMEDSDSGDGIQHLSANPAMPSIAYNVDVQLRLPRNSKAAKYIKLQQVTRTESCGDLKYRSKSKDLIRNEISYTSLDTEELKKNAVWNRSHALLSYEDMRRENTTSDKGSPEASEKENEEQEKDEQATAGGEPCQLCGDEFSDAEELL